MNNKIYTTLLREVNRDLDKWRFHIFHRWEDSILQNVIYPQIGLCIQHSPN